MAEFWSPQMEQAVARLMSESLPSEPVWLRTQAESLKAFPVGWNLWSYLFLRPYVAAILAGFSAAGLLFGTLTATLVGWAYRR
jgi:hypothetical protein